MYQEDPTYKKIRNLLEECKSLKEETSLLGQHIEQSITEIRFCRKLYSATIYQTAQLAETDGEKAQEMFQDLVELAKKTILDDNIKIE